MRNVVRFIEVGVLVFLGSLVALPADAQVERFTGTVQKVGGVGPSGFAQFRILIEEYSTAAEAAELLTLLAEKGWREVEGQLLKLERARFIPSGQIGHNIGYARSLPTEDGGRIIRLVSARPLFLFEALNNPRSRDYPFGVIEIRLDAEGKGQGSVYAAAQICFNSDQQLIIESYGIPPYSISAIEIRK